MSSHKTLHITNGDSAVTGMHEAGIIGDILPWRDVLHVGPVKNHDNWEAFDQARIEFLIEADLGQRAFIEQTFADRMLVMKQIHEYDSIYLWFEHDLYDQLQLLQVLTWLATDVRIHNRIKLIVTDLYLGQATAANFHELFRYSELLNKKHLVAAEPFWQALTHDTPMMFAALDESTDLPFMYPAFQRLCAEYPSVSNGLNQVQNTTLKLLEQTADAAELFSLYQNTETARFMGDSIFAQVLENLIHCKTPLIRIEPNSSHQNVWQNKLTLTAAGIDVLHHKKNHLSLNIIDTWIGGTHLIKPEVWCYDNTSNHFKLWIFE